MATIRKIREDIQAPVVVDVRRVGVLRRFTLGETGPVLYGDATGSLTSAITRPCCRPLGLGESYVLTLWDALQDIEEPGLYLVEFDDGGGEDGD